MAKFISDLGSVVIEQNEVFEQSTLPTPITTSEVYSTFQEEVTAQGLIGTIFKALPRVANKDVHALAQLRWPDKYGTTSKPWGRPADPVTGYRAEALEGDDWQDMVRGIAKSRIKLLESDVEVSTAIAAGIDEALSMVHKRGSVSVPVGANTVSVIVSGFKLVPDVTIPILMWRHAGPSLNYPRIKSVYVGTETEFIVYFDTVTGVDHTLDWQLVVR